MDKIQKARARVMVNHPFYGTIIASSPMKARDDIPTAATDMKSIFYNPKYIDGLKSTGQVEAVFCHEVLHKALLHGIRKGGRYHKLFNAACDYAINDILKRAGMELWPGALYSKEFVGMSAEAIYDELLEQARIRQKAKGGSLEDDVPEDALGQDVIPLDNLAPEERSKIERKVKQQLAQATTTARMCGKMSADLERLINEVLDPKVPWPDLLRDYMTRVIHNDESWNRRNRRIRDYFLPHRHNKTIGEIIFIGDTSGSITDEEIAQVAAEVKSVADTVQPSLIRMIWADTMVKHEETFDMGEDLRLHPVGKGGTDMRVPLDHCEQYDAQVVVLITDGYTPWPDAEPPYPLIVVCTTDVNVPIGQVVRI